MPTEATRSLAKGILNHPHVGQLFLSRVVFPQWRNCQHTIIDLWKSLNLHVYWKYISEKTPFYFSKCLLNIIAFFFWKWNSQICWEITTKCHSSVINNSSLFPTPTHKEIKNTIEMLFAWQYVFYFTAAVVRKVLLVLRKTLWAWFINKFLLAQMT